MKRKKRTKADCGFIAEHTGDISEKLCGFADSSAVMRFVKAVGEKSGESVSLSAFFSKKRSGVRRPSAVKRFFAVSVEDSVICSLYRRFISSLLLSPVYVAAVFFLTFGLYNVIALGIERLLSSSGTADISGFFMPSAVVLVSVILMFFRESTASKLAGSRFFSFFLNNIFMLDSIREYEKADEKNDEKAAAGKKKATRISRVSLVIPALLGIAAGAASLLTSFESVLTFIALFIGAAAVMYSPESGLSLILLIFPFAGEKLLVFCAAVMLFSYIMKVLRGKRNISFGYADIMLLLIGLFIMIRFGSGYAFIALALYAVAVNTVKTEHILENCIGALSFGFIISMAYGAAELVIETIASYIETDAIVIHTVESVWGSSAGFVVYAISVLPYFIFRAGVSKSSRIPGAIIVLLLFVVCYIDGIAASLPVLVISLILYFVISTGRVFDGAVFIGASAFLMFTFVPFENTIGAVSEKNTGVLLSNIGSAGELIVGKRGWSGALGNISGFSSIILNGGIILLFIISAALFILLCSALNRISSASDRSAYALCVVPIVVITAFSFRSNPFDGGMPVIIAFSAAMAKLGSAGGRARNGSEYLSEYQ